MHAVSGDIKRGRNPDLTQDRERNCVIVRITVVERDHDGALGEIDFPLYKAREFVQADRMIMAGEQLHLGAEFGFGVNNAAQ